MKVVPNHKEGQLAVQETPAPEPPVAATEPRGEADAASPLRPPAPPTEAHLPTHPPDEGAAAMAQSGEPLTRTQAQVLATVHEAVKSAVVSEINQHLGMLRNSLSGEVEKAVKADAASRMEKMIRDAVEKQISQKYQTALQSLNSDLTDQVVGRLAESSQVRTSFENMARNLVERLTAAVCESSVKTGKDLNARVAVMRQSFEETIAEMRADIEAALARAQASEKQVAEATLRAQEALERLEEADRIATEKTNGRLAAHLDACTAEFKERLAELSQAAAAKFEEDVKAFLLRLSGSV